MHGNRPAGSENAAAVVRADWTLHAADIRHVRRQVFVIEQGIPAALEWDGNDAGSYHVLASRADGEPLATGRLQADGRIGRMAVLAGWRGRGIGSAILQALLDYAHELGLQSVYLHAQQQTAGCYSKAGFSACGEPFLEAGIAHVRMTVRLARQVSPC